MVASQHALWANENLLPQSPTAEVLRAPCYDRQEGLVSFIVFPPGANEGNREGEESASPASSLEEHSRPSSCVLNSCGCSSWPQRVEF